MNKKLVALLMAGTISASALPFSALAAQPSNVSFTEIGAETDILGKKPMTLLNAKSGRHSSYR